MSEETYGDVTGEYLALRREAGLVETDRELVWVRGPDAVSFLDGLVTQHLGPVAAGGVVRSLFLEPKGKLQATLWVLRGELEIGLAVEAGRGEMMAGTLGRFLIRVEATVEPDHRPALEVWGPRAEEVLEAARIPVPEGWVGDESTLVARIPLGPLPRFLVVGTDRGALMAAGARPVGSLAATAVRVEAGEPLMGRDVGEGTIPHETGLVPEAVSFEKGCFLGYELVERIESRGRIRARLRGVKVRESVLPPEGADVVADGSVVGTLTSVSESLTLRAPVGLTVVRGEVGPGSDVEIRWEGGSAGGTVLALPMDDFPEAAAGFPPPPDRTGTPWSGKGEKTGGGSGRGG